MIDTLISVSSGDLRRAITYLQSASRLSSSSDPSTEITPRDIQEIAGIIPDASVNSFGKVLGIEILEDDGMDVDDGKKSRRGFELVRAKVKELMREGYSAAQLLSQVSSLASLTYFHRTMTSVQLHDLIILHPTLSAKQKAQCAMALAEADKALCDGADEELQILDVGLKAYRALLMT